MSGLPDLMRLAPRSVPYRVAENALQIAGFILLSVLLGGTDGGPSTVVLVVGIVLAAAAYETAYVRRFTYRITEDTFDIQSGVLSRREREIPFERVQNVDIAQNVFQRGLGIAEVRIETAGGGSSEARLRYVSRSEATRLQELVSRRKQGGTERDPGATDDIIFELGGRELGVLGLTSANFRVVGSLFVLVLVVGSAGAQQGEVALPQEPRMQVLLFLGPALALGLLAVLWVVSGIRAIFRYYGFRLLRHSDELRYERGLLQQYNGTIPLSKVQSLMIRENVIARLAGYASLAIETAGYSPGQGNSVESAIPIARQDRVFELARTVEGIGELSFERPPKRARTRYLGRYTIVVVSLVGLSGLYHAATGALPDWYLAAVVWVLVPPAAHLKWRNLGYYHDDTHVVTRRGFWTRRTTIVPYYRVQTVSDSQTVFQSRRDLATLAVDTASSGGFWGGEAVALDIDVDIARTLRERVHESFQESILRRQQTLEAKATADGGSET